MAEDKITYGESIEMLGKWIRMDYATQIREGETEHDASKRAADFVNNFLMQRANPKLYTETPITPQYLNGSFPIHDQEGNKIHSVVNIEPMSIKSQPYSTIEAISLCSTLKVLKEFELIANNMSKKYPEIKEAYDQKLKELSI